MNVNDYQCNAPNWEYEVYSEVLNRIFYGETLTIARHNRDEAERVYYEHHRHDLLPVEH